ncbi:hypothetical protein GCM10017044_26960 [Kordiimonas sediminis]|uniref:Solute-binding protein family 3/N-terminal domain-containing protein n=1 Tax=Kordiimonas sediminis TaxID=1735581 RepID=A0A919EB24_9PROT|nr:transporter substrate-binding domain-containing protein [Kordiimonas sediminis]GHF30189.1 hypothetical protein GCM10017044_26960 [Kordiimonas sediminis]
MFTFRKYFAGAFALGALCMGMFSVQAQNVPDADTPREHSKLLIPMYDYPPMQYFRDGNFYGEYVERLRAILAKADVDPVWANIPMTAESEMLDDGVRPLCTTGRVFTQERAKTWQYVPYLFDTYTETVLVISKSAKSRFADHKSITSIIQDQTLRGVFVRKNFYGQEINKAIDMNLPWISPDAPSSRHAAMMIAAGRADYTRITSGMWENLKTEEPAAEHLEAMRLQNDDTILHILIACSSAVPGSTIERISDAMKALGYQHYPEADQSR